MVEAESIHFFEQWVYSVTISCGKGSWPDFDGKRPPFLLLRSVLIDVIHKVTMFAIFPRNEYCAVTVVYKISIQRWRSIMLCNLYTLWTVVIMTEGLRSLQT